MGMKIDPRVRAFLSKIGKIGAQRGGFRAWQAKLTPEQKREHARRASKARWAKMSPEERSEHMKKVRAGVKISAERKRSRSKS